MLHKIPDSPLRDALVKLVGIQRTLVEKLCALPKDSPVTLKWLQDDVWPAVDADWVEKFWKNDKIKIALDTRIGQRQVWMGTIAKADVSEKQEILGLMAEQFDYAKLYSNPPGQRLTKTDLAFWNETPVRKAIKDLLIDFYTPWLKANRGYPASMLGASMLVTRVAYLKGATPLICPYCDTSLQSTEVDHFLPKSTFPFLSVHPDNFVPSCHDSNEASEHKGDAPPLDWDEGDQAGYYFHPRLRPAIDRFTLTFRDDQQRLSLNFVAVDPAEQRRVDNLDSMFKLTAEFWGRAVEARVQEALDEVASYLEEYGSPRDFTNVQKYLKWRASSYRRRVGSIPCAIFFAALFEFVANDDVLIQKLLHHI